MLSTISSLRRPETNNLNFGETLDQRSNEPKQQEQSETDTQTNTSETTDIIDLGAGAGDIELRVRVIKFCNLWTNNDLYTYCT